MKTRSRPLDFLLIGAPRAGTTSLFRYLHAHPRLYMPLEKEVPFFSNAEWLARGWDAFYDVYFRSAPEGALIGKMTPQYWGGPGVVERIAGMMPHVKLLVVYRHPIERAVSHHRLSIRYVGGELPPFEEAVSEHPQLVALSEYGRLTEHLFRQFPKRQVLPLFTEDLELAPEQTLDAVLEFLGLPPGFRPSNLGKRYNRSGSQRRYPRLVPLLKRNLLVRLAWKTLPRRTRALFKALYESEFSVKHDDLPAIEPALHAQLEDHYRGDLRLLEELIGRQVPWPELR